MAYIDAFLGHCRAARAIVMVVCIIGGFIAGCYFLVKDCGASSRRVDQMHGRLDHVRALDYLERADPARIVELGLRAGSGLDGAPRVRIAAVSVAATAHKRGLSSVDPATCLFLLSILCLQVSLRLECLSVVLFI